MQDIEAALASALNSYQLGQAQILEALDYLFILAGSRGRELGPPLLLATLNASETFTWLDPEKALEAAADFKHPSIAAVAATWRFSRLTSQLEHATELARSNLEPATEQMGGL